MKKQIILKINNNYKIIIEEISKELSELFDKAKIDKKCTDENDIIHTSNNEVLPCRIDSIIAIGNTSEISETQLDKVIPSKDNLKNNYWCYSKKDFSSNPTCIIHDSARSSFHCIMELLKKPKYCIIYKEFEGILVAKEINGRIEFIDDIDKLIDNNKEDASN